MKRMESHEMKELLKKETSAQDNSADRVSGLGHRVGLPEAYMEGFRKRKMEETRRNMGKGKSDSLEKQSEDRVYEYDEYHKDGYSADLKGSKKPRAAESEQDRVERKEAKRKRKEEKASRKNYEKEAKSKTNMGYQLP